MNTKLMGELVRLRYKLMWARTRTRNGKIALFFAGYILLVMAIAIVASGGFGAGIIAMRTGKGYPVAAMLLAGMYVQALLATILLGFGMTAIFSDTEMRRYPLTPRERTIVRHFIGILDPFWFLILALELGLALGMVVYGAGSFWLSMIAILLLFVSNYLFARVLGILVERLVSKKGGSTLLLGGIMMLGLAPAALEPYLKKNSDAFEPFVDLLRYVPPAGAARAMTHFDVQAFYGLAVLLGWIVLLSAALVGLERHPPKPRQAQSAKVTWDSPWERIGRLLGPKNGILVGQWLRFYTRNNRFRMIYPLAVPIGGFLVFVFPRQAPVAGRFAVALGAFSILGFMGTLQFAVNQFGYVGGGFRRYLLLPTDPAAVLRTGSYTFLLLGSFLIPIGTLVLALFPPVPLGVRGVVMFVGCAVSSMFTLNGVALWVSLLSPRRGNFNASFGNDLSLAGNVVVIGSTMSLIFGPRLLVKAWPGAIGLDSWWMVFPLLLVAVAFYRTSLHFAEARFVAHREQLLGIFEGRD